MNRKFHIAGVQYRPRNEINRVVKQLEVGIDLYLEMEPDNKFDSNAVKIIFVEDVNDVFLGYVPKKFSAEISALIENDIDVFCIVTKVNPQGKTWEMIEVEVYTEEPKNE